MHTAFSQTKKPITPEEFFAKNSIVIADAFPTDIIPGTTDESLFYLFESPVTEDGHGNVNGGCPNIMNGTPVEGYIVRGGKAVHMTATTMGGPTYSAAWQAKLNRGRNVIPDADLMTFSYSSPKVFKCEQIGTADKNGVVQVRYGVYF